MNARRAIARRPYGDLVFHVLTHVRETAHVPASVFDPAYVAFVARALGPAQGRTLAEDAAALGAMLPTHDALAEVQLLACLFASPERAAAAADRDLADLGAADVDAPALLPRLVALGPSVEVLRCAADLEREVHATLPAATFDEAALAAALDDVAAVAPALDRCAVAAVRSLRLRGRVLRLTRPEIWIGAPDRDLGPTTEHVAWQAAHEATVLEIAERGSRLDHATLERAALTLLAERANAAGRAEPHRRWLSHFGDYIERFDARSTT